MLSVVSPLKLNNTYVKSFSNILFHYICSTCCFYYEKYVIRLELTVYFQAITPRWWLPDKFSNPIKDSKEKCVKKTSITFANERYFFIGELKLSLCMATTWFVIIPNGFPLLSQPASCRSSLNFARDYFLLLDLVLDLGGSDGCGAIRRQSFIKQWVSKKIGQTVFLENLRTWSVHPRIQGWGGG